VSSTRSTRLRSGQRWKLTKMSSRHSWFLMEPESHAPAGAATGGSHPDTSRPLAADRLAPSPPCAPIPRDVQSSLSGSSFPPARRVPRLGSCSRPLQRDASPRPVDLYIRPHDLTCLSPTCTCCSERSTKTPPPSRHLDHRAPLCFRFLALFLLAQPAGHLLCACLPH
jgi:hypothetical protein